MKMNIYKFETKIRSINTDYLTDEELRDTMQEEILMGHTTSFELTPPVELYEWPELTEQK